MNKTIISTVVNVVKFQKQEINNNITLLLTDMASLSTKDSETVRNIINNLIGSMCELLEKSTKIKKSSLNISDISVKKIIQSLINKVFSKSNITTESSQKGGGYRKITDMLIRAINESDKTSSNITKKKALTNVFSMSPADFGDYIADQVEGMKKEINESAIEVASKARRSVNKTLHKIGDTVEGVEQIISKSVEKVRISLNESADKIKTTINESTDKVNASMNESADRVKTSINSNLDNIVAKLKDIHIPNPVQLISDTMYQMMVKLLFDELDLMEDQSVINLDVMIQNDNMNRSIFDGIKGLVKFSIFLVKVMMVKPEKLNKLITLDPSTKRRYMIDYLEKLTTYVFKNVNLEVSRGRSGLSWVCKPTELINVSYIDVKYKEHIDYFAQTLKQYDESINLESIYVIDSLIACGSYVGGIGGCCHDIFFNITYDNGKNKFNIVIWCHPDDTRGGIRFKKCFVVDEYETIFVKNTADIEKLNSKYCSLDDIIIRTDLNKIQLKNKTSTKTFSYQKGGYVMLYHTNKNAYIKLRENESENEPNLKYTNKKYADQISMDNYMFWQIGGIESSVHDKAKDATFAYFKTTTDYNKTSEKLMDRFKGSISEKLAQYLLKRIGVKEIKQIINLIVPNFIYYIINTRIGNIISPLMNSIESYMYTYLDIKNNENYDVHLNNIIMIRNMIPYLEAIFIEINNKIANNAANMTVTKDTFVDFDKMYQDIKENLIDMVLERISNDYNKYIIGVLMENNVDIDLLVIIKGLYEILFNCNVLRNIIVKSIKEYVDDMIYFALKDDLKSLSDNYKLYEMTENESKQAQIMLDITKSIKKIIHTSYNFYTVYDEKFKQISEQ